MVPRREAIALLASHQDQVVALPTGARCLATATNGSCPIAGLSVGTRAWTLQAHPEFVPELADHLLAGRTELIGAERVAEARASLGRPLDRTIVAGWIGAFFTGAQA
jgi:GMP synthase-like glutamine amidotransferase